MSRRPPRTFENILIANRGEIAVRVIRSAQRLGYRTVAVYSDADQKAPHVQMADQAVRLGESAPAASYLSIDRLIDAARRTHADAVHPGYGFLSENAEFARACAENGIVFIGPPAAAIELMANKAAAKRRMLEAGVPCVPGYADEPQDDATLAREARAIGFPVMVKAAAGGGGRGMRRVEDAAALAQALASARSEARNAFGSDELILERAVPRARHIELQVFADRHDNVIHLGERDCSIQRRHQKVIEEAPSPAVAPALRVRMGDAAVAAARAARYEGAGTVEFLVDDEGRFYFLEMNTRLQVEHAVTEMILGIDLVAWQLAIAAGEPLPLTQSDVRPRGHAIEARLYAEDPARQFLPQTGRVLRWEPPAGAGVRVDHALYSGADISPHYDAMIAKIIAHGDDREQARRRLIRALDKCTVLGVATNRRFLIDCLTHDTFAAGSATTGFIDTHFPAEHGETAPDTGVQALAAALLYRHASLAVPALFAQWRSTGPAAVPLLLDDGGALIRADVTAHGEGRYAVSLPNGNKHVVAILADDAAGGMRYALDGVERRARCAFDRATLYLAAGRVTGKFEDRMLAPAASDPTAAADGRVLASMNGTVRGVEVRVGQTVTRGQTLIVIEAMKMEHAIGAPIDGRVVRVAATIGRAVANRELLLELEPAGASIQTAVK